MTLMTIYFLDTFTMEDSMIGGEEEDLQALLEECGEMIGGPQMVSTQPLSESIQLTQDNSPNPILSQETHPSSQQALSSYEQPH